MKENKPAFIQSILQRVIWNKAYNRNFKNLKDWGIIVDPSGTDNDSDEIVTVKKGSRVSTAFACYNALCQDVAKIPFNVRRDTKNGKEIVKKDPVYHLIHTSPNNFTTSFHYRQEALFNVYTNGNSYSLIKRDGNLIPVELLMLPSGEVDPIIIDSELFFIYKKIAIPQRDILHLKMYSFDGIKGVSPIIFNAQTFGYRLKQDRYKAKVLGAKPPGILTFTQDLTDIQVEKNRANWKTVTQGLGLGGTPVLSGGAKYLPTMIPPNEGQMIEAAELSAEEIAAIYRVPPTIIQKYKDSAFKSPEQQSLIYLNSLTPILTMIEQECDKKLFSESNKMSSEPLYTKFNIKGMLRGDIKTQTEWYRMGLSTGLLSPDDVREMEDLPPLPDGLGKIPFIQGAMIPLDQIRNFYSGKSSSTDLGTRQLGFDLQQMKDNIERLEIMNKHENE